MNLSFYSCLADYIADAFGFERLYLEEPLNKKEERKSSFYNFLEYDCISGLSHKLHQYLSTKYPVKVKKIDYEDRLIVRRIFSNTICRMTITMRDNPSYSSFIKRPYMTIYLGDPMRTGSTISEFFIESLRELDNKIAEISNHIPEFKSEAREIKLKSLI